ncbi:hypothetical protein HJD18_00985 [Thermoleophilia bacterium SCSIO 60948]|nr:hypothetical protein HJD18_00985 [Thermoleophilia bacterium SCSIO 60948]
MAALVLFSASVALGSLAADESSTALFSDASSNPSNGFAANSSFTRGMASGTYSGNGTDGRQITGLGFRPDIVTVKATTAQGAVIRTRTMTGDQTKPVNGATAIGANRIEALGADGFQLGTDATVNSSGVSYQWWAATTRNGQIAVGSYVGDGASARDVATPGMAPEAVLLLPASATSVPILMSGMSAATRLDTQTTVPNSITALDSDGFQIGGSSSANTSAIDYHWIAFSESAGSVDVGSYTGNNMNNRSVSGLGFTPAFALVRAAPTASRNGVFRAAGWTGNASSYFSATANPTTGITALAGGGFTVGNLTHVNANGVTFHYLALADF